MLNILFEDNHLLVLNKPAGILTQPSGTTQCSLEQMAKEWIKIRDKKPGNVFLEAIHRLDKPVSGVVVFAKTSKALSRLNEMMRNKESRKIYHARVSPSPHLSEGTLEHYLLHDDHAARVSSKENPESKYARLQYRTLETSDTASLLEVILDTGRYHQIRIQLSTIGSPIIGDAKYGSTVAYVPEKIALHHASLQLLHPITKEPIQFQAPLQ